MDPHEKYIGTWYDAGCKDYFVVEETHAAGWAFGYRSNGEVQGREYWCPIASLEAFYRKVE